MALAETLFSVTGLAFAYTQVRACLWLFVAKLKLFLACLSQFVVVCGSLWLFVAVCGCLWQFVVVCGSLWLSVAVCGLVYAFYQLVVGFFNEFCGLFVVFGNFWLFVFSYGLFVCFISGFISQKFSFLYFFYFSIHYFIIFQFTLDSAKLHKLTVKLLLRLYLPQDDLGVDLRQLCENNSHTKSSPSKQPAFQSVSKIISSPFPGAFSHEIHSDGHLVVDGVCRQHHHHPDSGCFYLHGPSTLIQILHSSCFL